MRLLEYRLDLFGRGYWVTSGNRHYEEVRERERQPIRMHRVRGDEQCDFFEDLTECLQFNWDTSKGTEETYLKKYTNILLNRSPEWIIVGFAVTVGKVYIDLYNTKTTSIDFFYLATNEYGFDLRFEVPCIDEGSCSVYDVSIEGVESSEKDVRTTVTEYVNHVRREIEFFRKAPGSEEIYIEVTEYADL